jgi:hypothetical protein
MQGNQIPYSYSVTSKLPGLRLCLKLKDGGCDTVLPDSAFHVYHVAVTAEYATMAEW